MNTAKSAGNEIKIQNLENKNINIPSHPNYAQLNDNSTRNDSLNLEKNSYSNEPGIISINRYNFVEDNIHGTHLIINESNLSTVKFGYNNFNGINPISRYNFVIDRYNEEINRHKDIKLKKIPFNFILIFIFDTYVYTLRIIFAFIVIPISFLIIKKNLFKLQDYFRFNNFYYLNSDSTQYISNWRYFFISSLVLPINILILWKFFWIIFIIGTSFFIILLYSVIFVKRNKIKIKKNFFKNMIYSQDVGNSHFLNEYLVIDPGHLEKYSSFMYYPVLVALYKRRDMNVPQKFMLYGKSFKYEKEIINIYLLLHLLSLLFLSFYFSIKSVNDI